MVRAGEDYDYFFEVDGELRYDFNCDTNSVEVLDAQGGSSMGGAGGIGLTDDTAKMVTLTPGQIIIANSIQIIEEEDSRAFSMSAFSTCSSDDENNNNNSDNEDEWENGPVVSWPKHFVDVVKHLNPEPHTMVMPMPDDAAMFRFRDNNCDDVNMTTEMYYGYSDQYCYYNQQQQQQSSSLSFSGVWSKPTKRVQFKDMPVQNTAARANANAAATAMLTGTVF